MKQGVKTQIEKETKKYNDRIMKAKQIISDQCAKNILAVEDIPIEFSKLVRMDDPVRSLFGLKITAHLWWEQGQSCHWALLNHC